MIRSKDSSGNVKSISATVTELRDAVASRDIPTNINDAWYAYLGDQGFTGSLDDRMFAFLASRTGIDVADVSDLYARWNGVVTGAVLYHDFANDLHVKENVDGTFDDFITFERDSEVNGFTEGPVLTEFAVDEPAIGIVDPATGQSLGYRALAGFTNSLLWNRDLSTGDWGEPFGTGTVSRDATGLDGKANTATTATDTDAGSTYRIEQNVTISSSSDVHTASIYVKKDDDTTRFPEMALRLQGGSALDGRLRVNTSDGSSNLDGDGSASVEDAGDWWRLILSITDNGSGNTTLRFWLNPAASDALSGGNNTTGSTIFDFGGVYLDSSIAGPPIETEGSPVSTAADDATEPFTIDGGFVWLVHARTGVMGSDNQFLGTISDDETSVPSNRVWVVRTGSQVRFSFNIDGSVTNVDFADPGDDTDIKLAIRASSSGSRVETSWDGGKDGPSAVPNSLSFKKIGQRSDDTEQWMGTIALDWIDSSPGDYSDADLQELSS